MIIHIFIYFHLCVASSGGIRQNDFAYIGGCRTIGVSHRGNDSTGNPCFRGRTVGLQGMQMKIKLVCASTTQVFFSGAACFSRGCHGLVDLSAQWERRLGVYC